jgi:hypothetical protein
MLAAPTIYATARSPHGTTSDRPIPQSSSVEKVVRHCEFSEKFKISEIRHVSNGATENAWCLSNLICLAGNGPSSQQPPEGGCWAPFSCSLRTEGCPTSPHPGARYTFPHGRSPSSGTWGHSCSSPGALRVHTSNQSHVAEEKLYWRWKIAERCQVKAPYSHRSTTLRCGFF